MKRRNHSRCPGSERVGNQWKGRIGGRRRSKTLEEKSLVVMAEIKPIRAWRYNDSLDIDELTSPLFDVVSEKQRKILYKNPFNSIHLSVPEEPNPADRALKLLEHWKKDKTLLWDKIHGIYVYYQYFTLAGSPREYCRKGICCPHSGLRMGG